MGKGKVRVFLLRRRAVAALGALVLAGAIFYVVSCPPSIVASSAQRQLPIYCVEREQKMCSVSFDAAWGNEDTQELMDILDKYSVKTTFFVVGEWVDQFPESVRALAEAGHEIMNHSDTHPHFPQLSPEDMTRELNACSDKIEAITGVRPILFRPPYGDYDDKVVSTARAAGMYAVQWDVDSLDWKDPAPADITQRVLDRVQPGSIILFHNAAKNTPAALPSVLEGLIQKGYAIVPVSQLIYRENYTMDHTGRQCPNG